MYPDISHLCNGRTDKVHTERPKLRFELRTFLLWGAIANHHTTMQLEWLRKMIFWYETKIRKSIQDVISERCKASVCDGIVWISYYTIVKFHICEYRFNAKAYILESWRDILYANLKVASFLRMVSGYFSRTLPDLLLHDFQQHGFMADLPIVQICLLLKMYEVLWTGQPDCWAA